MQVLMNVTGCNAFASARFGSHDETITTSTFMIDAAKIHSFLFHSYAICDNCVDSGNKVGENYILCLILKFERLAPYDVVYLYINPENPYEFYLENSGIFSSQAIWSAVFLMVISGLMAAGCNLLIFR